MEFFIFIQMVFNLVLGFFILALLKKQNNERKDERLSQGLRLLEKKISLLKELSQQIDHQIFSIANTYKVDRPKIEETKKQTQDFKDNCEKLQNKHKQAWPSKVYDFKKHVEKKAKSFASELKSTASKEPPLTIADKPQTKLKLVIKDDLPEDSL